MTVLVYYTLFIDSGLFGRRKRMNSKQKLKTLPFRPSHSGGRLHSGRGVMSTVADEKGIVIIAIIGLVAILALLGTIGVMTTSTEIKISGNYKTSTKALYAAQGGGEYGIQKLRERLKSKLYPTTADVDNITSNFIANPPLSDYTFDTFTITQGTDTPTLAPITQGNYAGLSAFTNTYDITVEAGTSTATARVVLSVEDYLIPLFQFGVFYQEDLEILPGPNMTFSGGKIHSNSDIYLGANNTLKIDSKTTTAGDVFYRRKNDGSEMPGVVEFKDGVGNYQAVKIDGVVLDSDNPNWAVEALDRWDGNLKSKDHGIFAIDLVPLPEGTNPIDVIKRGDTIDPGSSSESADLHDARYYWKAGLRIVDEGSGVKVYKQDGAEITDVTYGGTFGNPFIIESDSLWDYREGKWMDVITVDMEVLGTNTNLLDELYNPALDSPGVLYVSQDTSGVFDKGVRLKNGSTLPSHNGINGLTVSSDNPVYVQGDYNSANKPAAVAADAITILSNNWNDANSNGNLDVSRIAAPTTVNAAIMTGNVPTDAVINQYSGGLENFPRFLEKWSGQTFTYNGSLVCLWKSEQATGNWLYGPPVYKAPIRNWSYGLDINNMPPGTPFVRLIQKANWYHDIQ
jgi:Tfp pilus assembly protein PilX